ncbi:TRAP transporter substrate-binding protein [Rapidithrix thailandica]|uniref:TRAP transporter substrate-binding protein n=1 Tax=Rapidithrix thailandica TaxID=413964 RepID=A0AAW9S7A7_9BACT
MKEKKIQRREFIRKGSFAAGAATSASLLAACGHTSQKKVELPAYMSKKFEWKCVTVWPPNFPVVGESINQLAKELETMSSGRLKIKVYGAGELVPAFEAFDAVTLGAVQMGHGVAYYWAGKIPSAVFFAAVPFGMNAQQMNAWLYYGGGWDLWRELYAKFGLEPFPCGNTGVQMGGWFNKEINSVEDLKGLKMRIPGLGGKVISKAGGSSITVAGGEIYTNLERGVIDATEWIGPYHDYLMGFHRVAKYYYYPGWHEPGPTLELFCNKKAYEELPDDLQEMVRMASYKYNMLMLSEFESKNNEYLNKIVNESEVQIKRFPEEVIHNLKSIAKEVVEEVANADPFAQKVYESYSKFKKDITAWSEISEQTVTQYL